MTTLTGALLSTLAEQTVLKPADYCPIEDTTTNPSVSKYYTMETLTNYLQTELSITITGSINTLIQTVQNITYTLSAAPGFSGTITGVGEIAASAVTAGSFTILINGNPVGGLQGLPVRTEQDFYGASGSNEFISGDLIQIIYSGTVGVTNHAIALEYSRLI